VKRLPKSDLECVELITAAMATNPLITRKQLRADIGLSQQRLDKLGDDGLVTLPRKIKPSESGKRGRTAAGKACEFSFKRFAGACR
jgi:hypothetical protein